MKAISSNIEHCIYEHSSVLHSSIILFHIFICHFHHLFPTVILLSPNRRRQSEHGSNRISRISTDNTICHQMPLFTHLKAQNLIHTRFDIHICFNPKMCFLNIYCIIYSHKRSGSDNKHKRKYHYKLNLFSNQSNTAYPRRTSTHSINTRSPCSQSQIMQFCVENIVTRNRIAFNFQFHKKILKL